MGAVGAVVEDVGQADATYWHHWSGQFIAPAWTVTSMHIIAANTLVKSLPYGRANEPGPTVRFVEACTCSS